MISNANIFYINSAKRISGSNASFSYFVNLPQDQELTHVCMLDFAAPKSFYLIQNNRNTFVLTEGIDTVTLSIPIGDYTFQAFINVLTPLLNANSPNSFVYSMSYPSELTTDTGK